MQAAHVLFCCGLELADLPTSFTVTYRELELLINEATLDNVGKNSR